MINFFTSAFLLIFSLETFSKIILDTDLHKNSKKRLVSEISYLKLAQSEFSNFISCAKYIEKNKSASEMSQTNACIQKYFFEELSNHSKLSLLIWLQQEIRVSLLFECEGESLELANMLKEDNSEKVFCFNTKNSNNESSTGLISFKIKDEHLFIYKIK